MDIFSLLFDSLFLLTTLWMKNDQTQDLQNFIKERSDSLNLPEVNSYDFIVVGGGLAGSVVASKLSEYHSVLLLEVGGNPPPSSHIPAYGPTINSFEEIAFQLSSLPHDNASLANGGIIPCKAGKILGGSSTLNGLIYHRGSRFDYDNWASLTNDSSWSWDAILPIFKRIENYEGEFPSEEIHGSGGPLTISKQEYVVGQKVWLDAAQELGFPIRDPNFQEGNQFSPVEFNKKNGRRFSIYDAYLKPVLNREKLTVLRYSEVEKVILDEENKMAIGVEFKRHGVNGVAFAKKEVILSAGAFGSPKILLRSGIGPSELSNIPLKVKLPVGENLQDHVGSTFEAYVNTTEHLFIAERDYTLDTIREFEEDGYGPLTLDAGSAMGVGYIVSSRAIAEGNPNWPDLQLMLRSYNRGATLEDPSTHKISMRMFLGRVKARGVLRLNSEDPASHPEFGFNYFMGPEGESDLAVLIEGIKMGIKFFEETVAYQKMGTTVDRVNIPDCPEEWGSNAYWSCYIRQKTVGFLHTCGSCIMGRVDDPKAVVNSKLQVIGIGGLRVIDASVMPEIPNSNIQAPTLVIAEKGVDEILDLHGRGNGDGNGGGNLIVNYLLIVISVLAVSKIPVHF